MATIDFAQGIFIENPRDPRAVPRDDPSARTPTLRSAVIGAGFIGGQHIETLRRIPHTRVAAIAEPDQGRLDVVARRWGVPNAFIDWRAAIDLADVVHVCTPNAQHEQVCLYAVNHGKHVYSEKPLTPTAESAYRLAEAARRRGVAAGVNQNYRHNVQVYQLRNMLQRNALGRILSVRAEYLQDWMLKPTDYDWRLEAEHGSMRALSDIGTHALDLMLWTTGLGVERVLADMYIAHKERIAPNGKAVPVESEDGAHVLMRLTGGVPATIQVSQTSAGHKNDLRLAIDCEGGALEWQQEYADELRILRRDGGNEVRKTAPDLFDDSVRRYNSLPAGHAQGWTDAFRNAMERYYEDVVSGAFANPNGMWCTFYQAARNQRILEAVFDSAKLGRWVALDN